MLRLSQAQPRQSEENEGGKGHERDQKQSGREIKRTEEECERNESDSTIHLQHLHQRQMQLRTTASNPRELEGKTLEGEKIYVTKIWKGSGRQHDVQHVQTQRKEFQDDMLTTTSVAIESESCLWMKVPSELKVI